MAPSAAPSAAPSLAHSVAPSVAHSEVLSEVCHNYGLHLMNPILTVAIVLCRLTVHFFAGLEKRRFTAFPAFNYFTMFPESCQLLI